MQKFGKKQIVQRTRIRIIQQVSICLLLAFMVSVPAFACSWDYAIWMIRSKNADPLYRFIRDGKAGYIDRTGKIVMEPQFKAYDNNRGEFHDGLLQVGDEYIDIHGKHRKFKNIYYSWDFSEGLARARDEQNNLWGYINTNGEFVIPSRFAPYPEAIPASSFSEGLARVVMKDRYGYFDHKGDFVIAPTFLWGDDFHDGMARVIVEGPCQHNPHNDGPCSSWQVVPGEVKEKQGKPACKYAYIDRTGKLITEERFEDAKDFSEGLAPVQNGEHWGYVNKQGQVAIVPLYDNAEPFSDGMGLVEKDGKFGYVDHSGRLIIEPQFKDAGDFSDGLAAVGRYDSQDEEKNDFSYINKEGKPAFVGHFLLASHFYKGLAHVRLKPEATQKRQGSRDFAYIDTNGKIIFRYTVADQ